MQRLRSHAEEAEEVAKQRTQTSKRPEENPESRRSVHNKGLISIRSNSPQQYKKDDGDYTAMRVRGLELNKRLQYIRKPK